MKRFACIVCISVFASLYHWVMGGLNLMCKCTVFFKFFLYSFVGTIANIYLAEKSLSIANWPTEDKKQYVFARQLAHTKAYI